jgi:hypothetical protein
MPFSTYLPEHMGSIRLAPPGPFVAGLCHQGRKTEAEPLRTGEPVLLGRAGRNPDGLPA